MQMMVGGGNTHTDTHRTTEETGVSFPRHKQLKVLSSEEEIPPSSNVASSAFIEACYQPSFPHNKGGVVQETSPTT